jgi:hypothetical protein
MWVPLGAVAADRNRSGDFRVRHVEIANFAARAGKK